MDKRMTGKNYSLLSDELKSNQENVSSSTGTTSTSTHSSRWSLTSIGDECVPDEVQILEKEETKTGTIGVKVYYQYFTAGVGNFRIFILLLLSLANQGAFVLSDWWLAYWSNKTEEKYFVTEQDNRNATKINIHDADTTFNVLVYSGIVICFLLLCLLRNLLFYKTAVDITGNLHNKMLTGVIMSPMRFFDRNGASGRILNRFSNDVGHLDDLLPRTLLDAVQCVLLVLGIVIVAGIVSPWVYTAVIPLLLILYKMKMGYISKANDIKRQMASAQSPIQSHILASAEGISSVRASNAKERMIEKYDDLQDLHVEANISFLKTSRWFAARLDILCAIFVTVVCVCCVFVSEDLDASTVGLSLTYAISLSSVFQWCVRQSAEVENKMVSVERVIEYTELPTEGPYEKKEDNMLPPDWPQKCDISVINTSLRYSDDTPLILKNLTFTIRAKEKVGIVGRTGAGKSSLINMLFRLIEPEGIVTIDDVDIQKIGLFTLRKCISIIPQEPVLFTGTLRQNLDPFDCYEDEDLWKALEEVQLKEMATALPQCLYSVVTEGGNNFSVGQRQLICLARAILRRNKILIIDEATANVDPRTDELIQQTVRRKFSHCTIITIAHRLRTVMESDKIMVLDDGSIKEYGAPDTLLQKPEGYFRQLVEQTGPLSGLYLNDVANRGYRKLHDDLVDQSISKIPNDVMSTRSFLIADDMEEENDQNVDDYVGTYYL